MSTTRRFMAVRPESVWDALADPGSYGYWVVGSKVIRDADADWPAPGARFHHTVGLGPLKTADHTEALEASRPRRLAMRARARPLGSARVELTMTPGAGGTLVEMSESPAGPTSALVVNPIVQLFTRGRNAESLMRLEELALRIESSRRS